MKKLLILLLITFVSLVNAEPAKKTYHQKHKLHKVKISKKKIKQPYRRFGLVNSYALFDYTNGQFNNELNRNDIKSIASITKLFTAITVINSKVDLNEKIYIAGENGGKIPRKTFVSRLDLLKAMVTNSDNLAAEVLAKNHPGGFKQFIIDVNSYNQSIGLTNTTIVDSSGLLADNKSTATDLVIFLHHIKDNQIIREISNLRDHQIAVPKPKNKKIYTVKFHNTNPDIYKMDNVLISKTGFTNPAGRCVVMLVQKDQKLYALVVLGARDPRERSKILHQLLDKSEVVHI